MKFIINMLIFFLETAPVSLESLVSILSGVLHDESPVAIRQACLALQVCVAQYGEGRFSPSLHDLD